MGVSDQLRTLAALPPEPNLGIFKMKLCTIILAPCFVCGIPLKKPTFWERVVTGDDSKVFQHDPGTQRQNLQWKSTRLFGIKKKGEC